MKKTYIEPKTTVVALDVRDNVMINASGNGNSLLSSGGNTSEAGGSEIVVDAREVIKSQDAWEEW